MDEWGTPSAGGRAALILGVRLVRWLTHLREQVMVAELMFLEWEAMMDARRCLPERDRRRCPLTPGDDERSTG